MAQGVDGSQSGRHRSAGRLHSQATARPRFAVNMPQRKSKPNGGPSRFRPKLVRWIIAATLVAVAALASPAAAATRQVVGFYVPWDAQSSASLALHVNEITVFAPQWINLSGAAGAFNIVPDGAAQEILQQAKRPPKVMPLVTNAHDARWDAEAADAVILDPSVQASFVAALAKSAEDRGFG